MPVPLISVVSAAAALFTLWLFATSGIQKLRPDNRFYYEVVFHDYGVQPAVLARHLPLVVGGLELMTGLAVLFPVSRQAAAAGAIVLLLGYAVLMARRLLNGDEDGDCGCAGPDSSLRLSGALLMRNLVAAALTALCLPPVTPLAGVAGFTLAAVLGGAMILGYASMEQLMGNAGKLRELTR